MVSNNHLLTLEQGPNNFIEHRKVPISLVNGFTLSQDSYAHELVIHCSQDHDERFNCVTAAHKANLINVIEYILRTIEREYIWYSVPDKKLRRYTTQKSDKEKEKWIRPDE